MHFVLYVFEQQGLAKMMMMIQTD